MDTLSPENEAKLLKATELIDQIILIGKSALEKFPTDNYDLIVFAFINYLDRFTHNFEAINILLKEYKMKPNIETSIGLTIRASLLDFLVITYLSTYQADITSRNDKENEAKFKKKFDGLMAEQIHYTFKYLKLAKEIGQIKNEEYAEAVTNTCYTYRFLFKNSTIDFKNPEKNLINTDLRSVKDYFKRIHNHPLTKKFSIVYDLYTYYSKYEHFGIMTHFIQRQGVDNDFETMIASMKYMTRGIGSSFAYLSYPIEKLKDEIELLGKLQDEFDKL